MSHIAPDFFAFLPSKDEIAFSSLGCAAGSGGIDRRKDADTAEVSDRRCAQRGLRVHFSGLGRMTAIGHRVDRLPNPLAEVGLVKYRIWHQSENRRED